ncbi:CHRD domain-containing protein [Microbacterium sp. ru370.1]|uniref:CHRD domain-containing protein n=1 Tax=unclassified Microbacterium TaxID=2609290 RepID=UPI000884FC0A|nr:MULTISPECIES: CHRD domain-containing protein [unclassified Microbacterium]SDO84728.1 CHRD domain-containing protein [Microbacterium sp. ru370.1]SIT90460.1 CHRD domain-containing protein [Microbacterium sp. RU1D]
MTKKTYARPLTIGALAGVALLAVGVPAHAETEVAEPAEFTSAFTVMATPDQVINNDGVAAPGEEGATGTFTFRINSDLDIICYDIRLEGVTGDYQSPAKTATHIHEAAVGEPGPPRIAFPNPTPVGDGPRTSSGCLQGPFTTGVVANGADTGEGFTLKQIEADPAGFTGDSHTVDFAAGVVRGQLSAIPVGGVDTGAGGSATADAGGWGLAAAAGGLGVVAAGALALRRRHASSAK